jgi:hypothetical protein
MEKGKRDSVGFLPSPREQFIVLVKKRITFSADFFLSFLIEVRESEKRSIREH